MPTATNQQMQNYCDQRIRPRAEAIRLLLAQLTDDTANIGDEYARAVSNSGWADGRTDGPPHLLQSGNGASPDDVLNYNAFAVALRNLLNGASVANGSSVAADAASVAADWPVLLRATVRPPQG